MAKLSPLFNCQTVTDAGVPASGWKILTYVAGSSTLQSTFTADDGLTAQANPIELDADGFPPSPIWLTAGVAYKFILTDENNASQRTFDDVSGINDTTTSASQWQASGVTPTYVSGTQFTLVGDQTSEFHVGRRLQFTVTAGTVYGVISVAAYTSLTTITVVLDSGALDSGLSAVNLSILRADHQAVPQPAGNVELAAGKSIIFEGTTADAYETTLSAGEPTVDRTITLPDATDTLVGKATTDTLTNKTISGADNTLTALVKSDTTKATTSGTEVDFTGIPAWVKRITLMLSGVSTSGTANLRIQLGDAGGVENSGYLGASTALSSAASTQNFTAGVDFLTNSAANVVHGTVLFEYMGANLWTITGTLGHSNGAFMTIAAGTKTLSATLDRIRLTTAGADTFDAGSANILYE
jgi:hypothetical protein